MIIDGSGHVVTNNHVVAGAQKLQVTLTDGRTFSAQVRGTDPSTDLAVITIDKAPSDLTPIAMGDSESLKVGDPVMAVGNPLGLAGTVTTGIVSALNRPVTTQAEELQQQQNPFNNGGFQQQQRRAGRDQRDPDLGGDQPGQQRRRPRRRRRPARRHQLLDRLARSSSGGQAGVIGIGFAIPVTEVQSIAKQLIDTGTAQHAYLGVTPQNGGASDGSATRAGAEITSVGAGTPAEKAGLQEGRRHRRASTGTPVDCAESLVGYVREQSVGSTVKLTVLRGGKSIEVKATLVARDLGRKRLTQPTPTTGRLGTDE